MHVRQAVPLFGISSMEASLRYYVDGLGFRMKHKWIDEGVLRWCWLELDDVAVMLQELRESHKPAGPVGAGMSMCFICDDAIAFYREVTARGIKAGRPFVGNGMWVTSLSDPDGYRLEFESVTDAPEDSQYED
jgi:catechol 2,3-dioxygenase-like lactoylglutathione lyase family enzyme